MIELRPKSDGFLALIEADLTKVDAADSGALRSALATHKILVARNQELSPDEFKKLAECFGILERHVLSEYHLPGHPDIMVLSNKLENGRPIGIADAGRIWHSDTSFRENPPIATILYGIELPPTGGDTLFIDMGRVYRELPERLRAQLTGVKGVFSYLSSYRQKAQKNPNRRPLTPEEISKLGDVYHEVLRQHPETNENLVFANEAHTVSLLNFDPPCANALLTELFAFCYKDGPDYVHQWRIGDVVIWDNRSVIHKATGFDNSYIRFIWRISIGA